MSSPPKYSDNPSPNKTYGAASIAEDSIAAQPLLMHPSPVPAAGSSRNAWMDQPAEDDASEDFKVGVSVMDCDAAIRVAFIRKVYAILLAQLGLTAVISLFLSFAGPREFVHNNSWIIFVSMIGSFASLFGVYWKRHDFPINLIVLALFTAFESVMVGTVTTYYDSRIVLQALFITTGVFLGLTLFTFQTRLDFTSFAPFLFAGIWGLLTASLVGIFLPFNSTFELVIGLFGVVLFSGYVLYDTQQIMKRLSVDEAILGALTLYLDFLNLFLSILRVLNSSNRD